MYLNIKIATWRVCKSVTFKVFNLRNNGSVWAKKRDPVQIRNALFCNKRIALSLVTPQFAQTILQYVIYGSTSVLYNKK